MKTLKQIIAESRELKESWRRDVEQGGIVSPDEEAQKLEVVPPAAKPPIKNAKRQLMIPRSEANKMVKHPPGKPIIRMVPKGTKRKKPSK